jgi:broad specificity phosphatase PhoE
MLDLFQSDNPKDPAGENFSEWMDREWLWFESNSVLKTRIAACIHDAIDRFPGRDVILVTHTGIMRSIISLKTGIAEKDINDTYNIKRIDNLSMSQFEYDGGIRKTTMINHIPIELVETLRQLKLTM